MRKRCRWNWKASRKKFRFAEEQKYTESRQKRYLKEAEKEPEHLVSKGMRG